MSFDRLRYELRLVGKSTWLTPPLVMIGFVLFLVLVNRGVSVATIARSLGAGLEMLLPMAAGVVIATIATHDRARELQLTMPQHYHRTAYLRFGLILGWTSLIALFTSMLLAIFHYWRLPQALVFWRPPWQFLAWQLTWLASLLWLAAVGLVCSLLLRSRAAGGALICMISIGEIIAHNDLNRLAWLHPIYLFPLTFSPGANYWLVNRFEILGTALALFVVAWFLLRQPELLLAHVPGDE